MVDHHRHPDGVFPDGSTVELQRFISNLVLMNAYFRRLRGDSSLLPPMSRLGLIVLDEGETLEIDSEDVSSSKAAGNGTPSFINCFRVLHVIASSFRSTLGNGLSGRPLHPFLARSWTELMVSFAMHGTKASPWCSQFCPSWVVFSGPYLPCNIVSACVPSQLAFAVLYSLSSRKCTVRFWKGTQMKRSFQGRPRSLILIAVLLIPLAGVNLHTPLRHTISCSDASHAGAGASEASMFVPSVAQQVQFSAETAAAETNEELA